MIFIFLDLITNIISLLFHQTDNAKSNAKATSKQRKSVEIKSKNYLQISKENITSNG